jgi:Domain of unknown function (DUF4384)/Putative peptidoglycan binding domain
MHVATDLVRASRRLAVKSALAVTLGISLAGCVTLGRDNPGFLENAAIEARPSVMPTRSISSFSEGLTCMDHLLRDQKIGTTYITSKSLADASGKAAVGTKDMVITALSAMSRTSNAFRFVDFEIDVIRQDTVQNLTNLLLNSNQMDIRRPRLYISGGISYVDSGVANERAGGGISAPRWEIGVNADRVATLVGLELHLGDFNTRTLIPGLDAANELAIGNRGAGADAGGKVRKAGIQFNIGRDMTQGLGPAVRTLVELGLIEIIGRWARIPYWQCLALDHAHPDYQRQLRDWWETMSPTERARFFQQALVRTGHYRGAVDGRETPALRAAMRDFQEGANAIPTGLPSFETYERLMRDYVAVDAEGKVQRIGWAKKDAPVAMPTAFASSAAPVVIEAARQATAENRSARALEVALHLTSGDQTINVGDALQVNISLSRTAHLTCYYRDVAGTIARLYPNPLQTARVIQARRLLLVPDANNPDSFSIEMTAPGREAVACFAHEGDVAAKLPAALRGPALEPLRGIRELAEVTRAHRNAAGSDAFGTRTLEWRVIGLH